MNNPETVNAQTKTMSNYISGVADKGRLISCKESQNTTSLSGEHTKGVCFEGALALRKASEMFTDVLASTNTSYARRKQKQHLTERSVFSCSLQCSAQ